MAIVYERWYEDAPKILGAPFRLQQNQLMEENITIMAPSNIRKQVIRSCRARGLTVHPNVLPDLEAYVEELPMILEQLKLMPSISNSITPEIWTEFIKEANEESADTLNKTEVEVISAYQTPRLVFDTRRKQYRVIEKQRPVLGNAEDKVQYSFQPMYRITLTLHRFRSIC